MCCEEPSGKSGAQLRLSSSLMTVKAVSRLTRACSDAECRLLPEQESTNGNRHVSKVACRARVSFRYAAPPARRGSWPSDDPSRGMHRGAAVDRVTPINWIRKPFASPARRAFCRRSRPSPAPPAACSLDNAACDFQKMQANAGELTVAKRMPGWNVIAYVQKQPVGGGVQNKPHLIGKRRAAAGTVRSGLRLVCLIKFSACPRALDGLVNMLGIASF
jgi:hypothetical protein